MTVSEKMVGWLNGMDHLLPFVGMVLAILLQSGSLVVIKVAMTDEMNKYVMIVYSFALSTFMLLPFMLFHRSERPPLKFSTLNSFFLLSLFGCSATVFSYVGIELSSPALSSAIQNTIPAFTFVLALLFRMEQVYWRHFGSQAKVFGTIVSMAGAFVVTLYKGPEIFKTRSPFSSNTLLFSSQLNWILGGLFCAGDSFLCSMWYIYQASVSKKYSAVMIIVFYQILFSTIQSAVFALIAVRDRRAWVLKLDTGLIAILYQAIAANVISNILCIWCVQRAGPLFCAMFKPLGIIFTVIMGTIFLGDDFHLGSLIGAVIIVVGFYVMMWGKATEAKKVERGIETLEESRYDVPLLQNQT